MADLRQAENAMIITDLKRAPQQPCHESPPMTKPLQQQWGRAS